MTAPPPDPGPPAGLPPTKLAEALMALARGERADLAALLHDVEVHTVVDGTRVTCHCHSVALDGMGRPRVEDLAAMLRWKATEFAIPRSRIAEAWRHSQRTGSLIRLHQLYDQALTLFTDIENSGEGGELLLFVLGETLLRLPQIMCKMSLKTNTRMHIHGADGVHAGVDPESGRLALYWGESKIYGDAASAIRECLASLKPMLVETGPGATSAVDLQLLQRGADLDDPLLEAAIKEFLDPLNPAYNQLEIRGLCLVGFDSDAYPAGVGRMQQGELVAAITAQLPRWKEQIANRVRAEQIEGFALHMMCVPFPAAEAFRRLMRESLGVVSAAA